MSYKYKAIRPKLWEVTGKHGRPVGRIRHVFSTENDRVGWQASDGNFYQNAKEAAKALMADKRELQSA